MLVHRKYAMKIISGAVVCLLFLAGVNAFASNSLKTLKDNVSINHFEFKGQKKSKIMGPRENGRFNDMLLELVKDGTLTKSEADKIKEYLDKRKEQRKAEMDKIKSMTPKEKREYFKQKQVKEQDLLSELVKNKILTQKKADTIKNRLAQKHEAQREERIKDINNKLNALVEKGTITKEQAAKVMENIKQGESERKAIRDKIKNMTPEKRNEYLLSIKGKKEDFLKKMVDDKILTQEQTNAIRKAIRMTNKKVMHSNKK